MFYTKTRINEETVIRTEITEENVFCTCPCCGIEHGVSLSEVFENDGDLYSTQVYCTECSAKGIARKKNNAPLR